MIVNYNHTTFIVQATGVYLIKLFLLITDALDKYDTQQPFHPSLIFAGKAGAHLSGATTWYSTLKIVSGLEGKYYTRVNIPANGKHSSLFPGASVVKTRRFYKIVSGHIHNTFYLYLIHGTNKLERLFVAGLSSPVSNLRESPGP
jgi:hypothetical protein